MIHDVMPETIGATMLPSQEVAVRPGPSARYLLQVGGFGPSRNILGLLNACGELVNQPTFAGTQLVFVGKREGDSVYDESRDINDRLEQNDLKDRVKFLGFQPDESLVLLYQAAAALLLPSFVEGFGLSAVEAARCSTPAIVTRVGAGCVQTFKGR